MCTCLINLLCPREHHNHHRLYETNQGGYYYPTNASLTTANQLTNGGFNNYYPIGNWANESGFGCRRRCCGNQGGYFYDPVAVATAGQIENGTLTGNYYQRNGGINQCGCHPRTTSTLAVINCMF